MTEQHTSPRVTPVPAVPIIANFIRKGEWRVTLAGRTAGGTTLRDAIDAAVRLHTQKEHS